jgi:hypothetical protein
MTLYSDPRLNMLLITLRVRFIKRADLVLMQAKYYVPKIARLYRNDPRKVKCLPNPVELVPNEGFDNQV